MLLSNGGKKLIKNAEGLRLQAYFCSAGKLTIGYGHKILPEELQLYTRIKPTITIQEAEALFERDQQKYANALNATMSGAQCKLNQNQFDALVAFIFNVGIGAWNGSTACRDLVAGKLPLIAPELRRWVHDDHGKVIDGLVNRREKEIALFNTPIAA